jgi:hypothetical protein
MSMLENYSENDVLFACFILNLKFYEIWNLYEKFTISLDI